MQSKISRRSIVKGGLIAGALLPTIGLVPRVRRVVSPLLDPKDLPPQYLHFCDRCDQSRCRRIESDVQTHPEMRQLRSVSGQSQADERVVTYSPARACLRAVGAWFGFKRAADRGYIERRHGYHYRRLGLL